MELAGDRGRRWETTMGVGDDAMLARIVLEPYLSLKNRQHLFGWPAAFFWRPTSKHGTGRQNTLATVEN